MARCTLPGRITLPASRVTPKRRDLARPARRPRPRGSPSTASDRPRRPSRRCLRSSRLDRLEVDVGGFTRSGPRTNPAEDALSAMVSPIRMSQSTIRLSISSIAGATASVASMTSCSVHPSPGEVVAEDERDLDLHPRVAVAAGTRPVRRRTDLHVVQQVAVVRLVDAHHLLHRLRREPDLVPADPGARVQPTPDVEQLDLVGVDHVEVRPGLAQRRDRRAVASAAAQGVGRPRVVRRRTAWGRC